MKTINLEIQVPDWVEWIACDESGFWSGFSAKPEPQEDGWWKLDKGTERTLNSGGSSHHENLYLSSAGVMNNPNWKQSLRKV